MSETAQEHMEAPRERFGLRASLALAATLALFIAIGFVLLPAPHAASLWDAICRAASVPETAPKPIKATPAAPSPFTWTPESLVLAASGRPHRAADLAAACSACHGANGIGVADIYPNLAGQPAEATLKQLADYKSGERRHPLMAPMAAPLSERQMADLAAYYADMRPPRGVLDEPAPKLVTVGDPLRNIAPCGSCHGSYGYKTGSPWLFGQKRPYLETQLHAFANGERANDINQQMRAIARALTPQEVETLAAWYAGERGS